MFAFSTWPVGRKRDARHLVSVNARAMIRHRMNDDPLLPVAEMPLSDREAFDLCLFLFHQLEEIAKAMQVVAALQQMADYSGQRVM
jgi:hypothetical protein